MRGRRMADGTYLLIASLAIIGLATTTGCRTRGHEVSLSNAAIEAGRVDTPQASANKIAGAGHAVVSACATQPYANASKGLIVDEPGLHEDVLDLRDRKSFRAIPFGLNESARLEALLEKEAGAPNRHAYPAEQIACIQQFAAHLQSLTQPLIEADQEQKQLDISAFDKATKEAEQETEEQTEQEDKAIHPTQSVNQ